MPVATIENADLAHILTVMKREQVVSGKRQAQVEACMLSFEDGVCGALSLTRDLTGLTYVRRECSVFENTTVPIPDIDRVLSILKVHGPQVHVSYGEGKVVFRSGRKQTTLQVSDEAKAFSHSPESVRAFHEKSCGLALRINGVQKTYTDRNGTSIPACATFTADAADLYAALRCDAIGNQRLNRFVFEFDNEGQNSDIKVIVGDPMYGLTETKISTIGKPAHNASGKVLKMAFDGGLDFLFKHKQGSCDVFFFDFTHEEQGYRFGVLFNDGSWAFQAGVL